MKAKHLFGKKRKKEGREGVFGSEEAGTDCQSKVL